MCSSDLNPIRIAFHRQRPVVYGRKNERRRFDVVAEEIALGEALLRPEDLVEVADAQHIAAGKIDAAVAMRVLERAKLIEKCVQCGPAKAGLHVRSLGVRSVRLPAVATLRRGAP